MAEQRRSLTEGLSATPQAADPQVEKAFVFTKAPGHRPPSAAVSAPTIHRVQLSSRIRDDYFAALKRASLERQMNRIEPSTIVEILEEALEPWLKANGYLS